MMSEDVEAATLAVQNLSALRDDPTFSDVTVVVEEAEFQCHRNILGAASDFFKAAFTIDTKEANERKITLHDVDKTIFAFLLDFIYCGKYIINEDNLFDIWAAADMLQIKNLVSQCKKQMSITLRAKNSVSYLVKVRKVDEDSKQCVLDFICTNIGCEEIHLHKKLFNKDELKFILGSDKSNTVEDFMTALFLSWVQEEPDCSINKPLDSSLAEDDSRSEEKPNVPEDNVSDCVGELLEMTKYMLISEDCLHGALRKHHLMQGNQKCEAIFEKILWYQSQYQLQQSWCPPAAIHRQHSDMVNVLVICKLRVDCFALLDLKNMVWKDVRLASTTRSTKPVLCYGTNLFIIQDNNIRLYLPGCSEWRSTNIDCNQSLIRVIGKTIYFYKFNDEGNNLLLTQVSNSPQSLNSIENAKCVLTSIVYSKLQEMSIKEITSIGTTHVVFFGRDDLDNYTIVCVDSVLNTSRIHSNQLGSRSKLVTFGHEREVFVLQENGCLWRMRQDKKNLLEINLSLEFVLWDGDVSLAGAVLYNDELLVVGEFPDQPGNFEILNRSLDGVFKTVRKVKRRFDFGNKCPRVSLAVLPKSLLP